MEPKGAIMQDAWRAYLEMALGLTETPRKRAQKVAGELVSRGGATAAQLQGLVEDGDVVGGGVRFGIARAQQPGEGLTGAVQETQQRV